MLTPFRVCVPPSQLDHPNCVKLFEMFESSKKVYMVLELLTGGELFDRIVSKGSYSEAEAAHLVKDVTEAIQYCHSQSVVHRDLKPENLIYLSDKADSVIKITDFGLAKYRKEKNATMSTACGTPGYVAPEVLKGQPYDHEVDVWSLGVILYILLCGFPPFYHESTAALYKQIKKGKYDFPSPYWDDISDEAKSLVRGMLTVDPNKRLTTQAILDHPWITTKDRKETNLHAAHGKLLKEHQLRGKIRRAVQMVMAVNKFTKIFKGAEIK